MTQYASPNWTPGRKENNGCRHHDIIAHRVVDFQKSSTKPTCNSKNNKVDASSSMEKSNAERELRELKKRIAKQNRDTHYEQRGEQIR